MIIIKNVQQNKALFCKIQYVFHKSQVHNQYLFIFDHFNSIFQLASIYFISSKIKR